MIRSNIVFALLGLGLLGACAKSGAAPQANASLSTKAMMSRLIDPAASVLWDSTGAIETPQGWQWKTPTTDAGWTAAENAAATVAEDGNLLLRPGRVRRLDPKDEDWSRFTHQMMDLALADKAAIAAKDGQKMLDIGGRLYDEGCMACHAKYRDPYLP